MPRGFAIRLKGGPYDGRTMFSNDDDPPERITVLESQVFAPGVLGYVAEGDGEPLPDEALYVRLTASSLPLDIGDHPNVMRGGIYAFDAVT